MTTQNDTLLSDDFYINLRKVVGAQVMRVTGDSALADDIINDVAIAILEKLQADQGSGNELNSQYIFALTRNKLTDHLRKISGKEHGVVKKRDKADPIEESPQTPEEILAERELLRLIHDHVKGHRSKEILVDGLMAGTSQRDIAKELGVTDSRVSQQTREIGKAIIGSHVNPRSRR